VSASIDIYTVIKIFMTVTTTEGIAVARAPKKRRLMTTEG
jgi:hypothetical protein